MQLVYHGMTNCYLLQWLFTHICEHLGQAITLQFKLVSPGIFQGSFPLSVSQLILADHPLLLCSQYVLTPYNHQQIQSFTGFCYY
jgi:hypothetical protein